MNILLTGASRGIGKAAADALTAAGHNVIGTSTRGGDGLIAADFADPAAASACWAEAVRRAGRIDALVNNAGVYEGIAEDAPEAEWQASWARTLQVNLQAAADLCRQAVGHFQANGGGRIVNVASRAGYRGDSPQHWHYAASKAALIAVTKTIARGHAVEGIYAWGVAPGFTVTEMTEEYLASRGGEKVLADIPLGRVASAAEVGETIRWLATEAPASTTGSVIDVNGASYVR
ncbi:NAD(P)-dependent dehydrogenase (short-subunit alcohol dehydrogenase family) [Sphingomonas kaistensis]|uniref:NAD(P)-dependent dehydrogenase (Short-subunit alcohol dehydrogenase family) n=1 Tax=Sphingomonas kaistensis TaxID=298708 RepID=A0A7X5Y7D3_9SPHN|nr:SDR family oxidoreductase [Sphingomonas kaistensis]NJC05245.1 NAD(P)-dependent dehydrogenase (short-subunit alcohol dehydrogenase family) [Sphingomonas kaistensis]